LFLFSAVILFSISLVQCCGGCICCPGYRCGPTEATSMGRPIVDPQLLYTTERELSRTGWVNSNSIIQWISYQSHKLICVTQIVSRTRNDYDLLHVVQERVRFETDAFRSSKMAGATRAAPGTRKYRRSSQNTIVRYRTLLFDSICLHWRQRDHRSSVLLQVESFNTFELFHGPWTLLVLS
jgi:hypothetical protein